MTSVLSRFTLCVTALALPVTAWGNPAGVTIDVAIPDGRGGFAVGADFELTRFLNAHNCDCATAAQVVIMARGGTELPTTKGELWFGSNCDDADDRDARCVLIESFDSLRSYLRTPRRIDTTANQLMFPTNEICESVEQGTSGIFLLLDDDEQEGQTCKTEKTLAIDTSGPEAVTELEAQAGDSSVVLAWKAPAEGEVRTYYAFCRDADTGAPTGTGGDGAAISGARCPGEQPGEATGWFTDEYLCGSKSGGTGLRLSGLRNSKNYEIALVGVDPAGNTSLAATVFATPIDTVGFWELYETEGGVAEGGFCSAHSGSESPLRWLIALGILFFVVRRRTNRAGRWSVLIASAIVLSVGTNAHAESYDGYWDGATLDAEYREPASRWNLGLRIGPYLPDIDKAFAGESGPYQRFFGSRSSLLVGVDVDRIVYSGFGQFGVAMTFGLSRNTAGALVANTMQRTGADKNRFYVLPTSIGAVYRLSVLDELFSIPVVPYAKAGLAYYMWGVREAGRGWARGSNGAAAVGGSLGFEGAVGVAVRLERLDPRAATNLQTEMGIEHLGAFIQWGYADVDHFGTAGHLSLGGQTWSVGLNVEY